MNKKNIIIVIAVLILVAVAAAVLVLRRRDQPRIEPGAGQLVEGSLRAVEFMTAEDKENFQLSSESRVQVISRDGDGAITVYKIIRDESEVVGDPSRLPPLSPAQEDKDSLD